MGVEPQRQPCDVVAVVVAQVAKGEARRHAQQVTEGLGFVRFEVRRLPADPRRAGLGLVPEVLRAVEQDLGPLHRCNPVRLHLPHAALARLGCREGAEGVAEGGSGRQRLV